MRALALPDSTGNLPPEIVKLLPASLPATTREQAEGVAAILAALELDAVLAEAGCAAALLASGAYSVEMPPPVRSEALKLAQAVRSLPEIETLGGNHPPSPAQAENLRKLLLAAIRDPRVLVIRLAERLHALRAAKHRPPSAQQALARGTREIYAPLANRLGIWQLKWELEDWAFRYLEPQHYRQVAGWLNERRADRETFIAAAAASLRQALHHAQLDAEVAGRAKHIYSIWRKLQRKQLAFDELYDVHALRVLVGNVADCYAALGVVHSLWHPLAGEFNDYISAPKDNFYRSLHTAVLGPDGRPMETQIRTHEMHRHAELGVAAHWRYKEGGRFDAGLETRLGWLRRLLAPTESDADFLEQLRTELAEERVYALTPKGEVVDLPRGATPLDFAYYIHSDVGHRCRGARVNGRLAPLTQPLANGDQVEILTTREAQPSRDWLNPAAGFLFTARARDKLRAFFRARDREQNLRDGRELLERELQRLGLREFRHERLLEHFPLASIEDVFVALGAGDISIAQLAGALQREAAAVVPTGAPPLLKPQARAGGVPAVVVAGVGDLLTHLARCCQPLPGEAIRGYVTRGRGISVHRADCAALARLLQRTPERELPAEWEANGPACPAGVLIEARERPSLLAELTATIAHEKIPLLALRTQPVAGNAIRLYLSLAVTDVAQLARLLARLAQVAGVRRALRG